ncbi:hypothetical protein Tco_0055414, partial [Tanacetum coccineum]
MADVTNSVGSSYLGGDRGCLTVDNHDEDVVWRNITSINGGINDGKNDAIKVFDEMPRIKFLGQYGSVREYYDAFVPFASRMGWNELCAVSMFIFGLEPEMGKK